MRKKNTTEKPQSILDLEKKLEKKRKEFQAKVKAEEARDDKMIAETFFKYCEDAYCFEPEELDRIFKAATASKEFKDIVADIKRIDEAKKKDSGKDTPRENKSEGDSKVVDNVKSQQNNSSVKEQYTADNKEQTATTGHKIPLPIRPNN